MLQLSTDPNQAYNVYVCKVLTISLTLLNSANFWDRFNLDLTYRKKTDYLNQLTNLITLVLKIYYRKLSWTVEFLENTRSQTTACMCLVCIVNIISKCLQIGSKAFLILNHYILGLIWQSHNLYLIPVVKVKKAKNQLQVQHLDLDLKKCLWINMRQKKNEKVKYWDHKSK